MALWTPANLTSVTLAGWYRLRDPAGVIAQGADVFDGTNVTAWKDRSGLGNDLPRLPNNNPADMVYQANGFGTGLASVHTNGMYYGTGWIGPVNVPTGRLGAFVAMQQGAQVNTDARIVSTGSVAAGESGNQDYSQPNIIALYSHGTSGTEVSGYYSPEIDMSTPLNTPMVVGTYFKNAGTNTQALALNGVEMLTSTVGYDQTIARLGIGTNGAYKGAYFAGDHAEYVLFIGTLSLDDQQKLEGYLAWNNGTQGSLPTGHPYKNAAPTISGGTTPVVIVRRRMMSTIAS